MGVLTRDPLPVVSNTMQNKKLMASSEDFFSSNIYIYRLF